MSTFHERKKERKEHYEKWVKEWKQRPCGACNGSGYYDHDNSPPCGACDGTGKETYNPIHEEQKMIDYILKNGKEIWTNKWWKEYKETPRGLEFMETEDGKKIDELFSKRK